MSLHGPLVEAYDRIIPTADYPIEGIEVPFTRRPPAAAGGPQRGREAASVARSVVVA